MTYHPGYRAEDVRRVIRVIYQAGYMLPQGIDPTDAPTLMQGFFDHVLTMEDPESYLMELREALRGLEANQQMEA